MALKRLPIDVQSLLSASAQVNSYKRAIEEFVYNSLDAKSTSIAIRIHIQENSIQVIDNGYGITKHDFSAIGERHMTSKVTDLATLKAAPNNYGFRGEFLANLITVSQMVKITSRHESTEETWAKAFNKGKEMKFAQMTARPTKGTTVDIKGFLYNLNIQKRGIDSINELQNIKSFLEQLSLVHHHVSLSLRDDSQNEIVFKIHKKRDIYQTLNNLFNIDKYDVQELQVEKHEYKVKGYIGKMDKDLDLHWIFLNGKFVQNGSKLHKVLIEYFKNSLHIKDQRTLKSKKNIDEHSLFNQNIPFYFIFVTCPYIDYDISLTPKQSVLEFKNWIPVNKLLEKLIKFYAGDVTLKEIKKIENKRMNKEQANTVHQDTRDQVKKIMDKILGSNSKKLGISQLQNGVKGKMVKRKVKKNSKNRSAQIGIQKFFLQNDNHDEHALLKSNAEIISDYSIKQDVIKRTVEDIHKKKQHQTLVNPTTHNANTKIPGPKKYKTKEMLMRKKKKELKANILSPEKKRNKITKKQKHKLNKHKKVKLNKNEFKYFKDSMDSVCKRSKIVAQKVEDFLHQTKKRNVHVNQLENINKNDIRNTMFLQNKCCAMNDKPLPPKTNKYIIENYIMNKIKTKPYKTTYDLVQTVFKSQQELFNVPEELYNTFHKRYDTSHYIKVPKEYTWTNKYICNEYSNNNGKAERVSQYTTDIHAQYKNYSEYEENFNEYHSLYEHKEISDLMTNLSERFKLVDKEKNIYSQNQNIYCTQKETSYRTLSGPVVLTYDSHQYNNTDVLNRNDTENCYTSNKRQNVKFITKESRDNFVTSNDFKNRFIKLNKRASNKIIKTFDIHMKQTIDESYTIEYTKSNENNCNAARDNIPPNSVDLMKGTDHNKHTSDKYKPVITSPPVNDLNPVFGNTYTIYPSNFSFDVNFTTETQTKRIHNIQSPELIDANFVHSHPENNEPTRPEDDFAHNNKNFNIVFVSKSQRSETVPALDNNMTVEPLNVCETVFCEIGSDEKEFGVSFNENHRLNDSLYGNIKDGTDKHVQNEHVIRTEVNDNLNENVSHHFSCAVKTNQPNLVDNIIIDNLKDTTEKNHNEIANKIIITEVPDTVGNFDPESIDCNFEINFNLKNRPRFVPKGMSQIFENCCTKTTCDYNMDKEYYKNSIYNNFANDVQINTEIYEPTIQNVDDLTTKNIHKFQNKVKKDNASLVFDEISLKDAKVLGQADCKFIVAIMKNKNGQLKGASEYLILFDQHAVHERIRLEKNLADYLNEERWTSVPVDNITLKMSKDEILYLHNYKDKFTQLGLQWTIWSDNEVTVLSIPEAIIGKNPREVEKVIKAVRNLILEEINVIKLQKGCMSLYPKSIMDLIFSESCRYAIKFGDQLSKNDCVEMLKALSACKTPFQCAHGRPVMAVIMDIVADKREYKINKESLRRFRQINTRRV